MFQKVLQSHQEPNIVQFCQNHSFLNELIKAQAVKCMLVSYVQTKPAMEGVVLLCSYQFMGVLSAIAAR